MWISGAKVQLFLFPATVLQKKTDIFFITVLFQILQSYLSSTKELFSYFKIKKSIENNKNEILLSVFCLFSRLFSPRKKTKSISK
jgi:hypothetical protein